MRQRELWLARVYYFVWVGALGFWFPFIALFYRERGLSGGEIGLILTCASIAGLIASPLWGRWSDSGANLPRILQLGLVATAIATLAISQQWVFALFVVAACAQALAGSGVGPLSDTLALRITAARRAGYGSVRVFGSAGWAVTVLFCGWMVEQTGLVFAFIASAIGYIVAALLLFGMRDAPATTPLAAGQPRAGIQVALRELVSSPALLGFALALFVRGVLVDGTNVFGNIYLQQLGANTFIIGVASMMGAAVELVSMPTADRLVRRHGAVRVLYVSFLISGSKFLLILFSPAVWSILAARAIEGVGFGLYLIALMSYVTKNASNRHTATMLAFFTVTIVGLIEILGAPLGGVVFDAFGAYWLYAMAMVGQFLALGIFYVFQLRVRKQNAQLAPAHPPQPAPVAK